MITRMDLKLKPIKFRNLEVFMAYYHLRSDKFRSKFIQVQKSTKYVEFKFKNRGRIF